MRGFFAGGIRNFVDPQKEAITQAGACLNVARGCRGITKNLPKNVNCSVQAAAETYMQAGPELVGQFRASDKAAAFSHQKLEDLEWLLLDVYPNAGFT